MATMNSKNSLTAADGVFLTMVFLVGTVVLAAALDIQDTSFRLWGGFVGLLLTGVVAVTVAVSLQKKLEANREVD